MKEKYKKENLEKIVKDSTSFRDCLRKLKLKDRGGNFKTLKKYIKKHNISTDHFLGKYQGFIQKHKENIIPNEKVFIKNSTYNDGNLLKKD